MSIVETYVPFTRKPPPGKRNRPGRAERFLSETEELPLSPSRQLSRRCRALDFWFRYDLKTRLCNADL